jgi:hypothetical protein
LETATDHSYEIPLSRFSGDWDQRADLAHEIQLARRKKEIPSGEEELCSIMFGRALVVGKVSEFYDFAQRLMESVMPMNWQDRAGLQDLD